MEQTQPTAPVVDQVAKPEKAKTKRKFKINPIILIAAGVLLIAGIVILVICLINANKDKDKTVYDTDAFFIRENGSSTSLYALFKENGDRKTDFIFNSVGQFIDNYALVRNKDNKYGIINNNGDVTVEFGQYEDISTRGGLYEVLIDNQKTLIKGNGDEVISGYRDIIDSYNMPYVTVLVEDTQYKTFNALGDEILSFESTDRPKFEGYDQRLAGSMHYAGHTILLNNKALKVEKDIESDTSYTLSSASKDLKTFVFSENGKYSDGNWATYHNGKVSEYGEKCKTISLIDESKNGYDRKYMTCRTDEGTFLIRNGEVSSIDVGYGSNHHVAYDENHYAGFDSKEGKLKIYVDGNEKATIDSNYAPTITGSSYFVRDTQNKRIALYDLEGNQLYELKDVTYGELNGVDKNGNIIVNDPSQANSNERYYLVNKEGKELSKKYSSIARHGEYYSAYNYTDKTADLLDKDGNIIISGDYKSIDFYKDDKLIFGKKEGSKVDLLSANGRKVAGSYEGRVSVGTANYFIISTDDKNTYYTFDGNEIYQQSKQKN
ncbi:WG repeat-containing protein [Candidatus Saccharibacteria bacterium]|nr:WG repeat-containing protein [Candidatus Saccharibacteria bacterium]